MKLQVTAKTAFLMVMIFGTLNAQAQIMKGLFTGTSSNSIPCSLNIHEVSSPRIEANGGHYGSSLVYRITFETSLQPRAFLIATLKLVCADSSCKSFSTDLRQWAAASLSGNYTGLQDTVFIHFTSDKANRGGSIPQFGSVLPAYVPYQVSTHSRVCSLK